LYKKLKKKKTITKKKKTIEILKEKEIKRKEKNK